VVYNDIAKNFNIYDEMSQVFFFYEKVTKERCYSIQQLKSKYVKKITSNYNNRLIEESYQKYRELLELLESKSDIKDSALEPNKNPRCFIVIEVENKNSRKHRLGSLVNASALGKTGIIVASSDRVFTSFVKIRKYLAFLNQAQKNRRRCYFKGI